MNYRWQNSKNYKSAYPSPTLATFSTHKTQRNYTKNQPKHGSLRKESFMQTQEESPPREAPTPPQ